MPFKVTLTEQQKQEICEKYRNGVRITPLAREYHKNTYYISKILREHDVHILEYSECNRQHSFNESYFETIDSEDKAYWVGFLLADGNICLNSLRVGLQRRDEDHLLRLLHCMQATCPIYHRAQNGHESSHVSLTSKTLVDTLARLNIVPAKSLIATVPDIPKHLERHFWRGMVDGDGSIQCVVSQCSEYASFVILVGTHSVCSNFSSWISRIVGRTPSVRPRGNIFRTEACGVYQVALICQELYRDATVCLPRKRDTAVRIIDAAITTQEIGFRKPRHRMVDAYMSYLATENVTASSAGDVSRTCCSVPRYFLPDNLRSGSRHNAYTVRPLTDPKTPHNPSTSPPTFPIAQRQTTHTLTS